MVINYLKKVRKHAAKIARSAGLFIGASILSLPIIFSSGCGKSPFDGMTLEEKIAYADTLDKADEYVDYAMYAHGDTGGADFVDIPERAPNALNGAERQSLRATDERHAGVCRDFSVAIAALLHDDLNPDGSRRFPAVILDYCTPSLGHSIFLREDPDTGRWYSRGNRSEDDRNNWSSRDSIIQSIGPLSYDLYDLSPLGSRIVEGTTFVSHDGKQVGLINMEPFLVESYTSTSLKRYSTTVLPDGSFERVLLSDSAAPNLLETIRYSSDCFEVYIHKESPTFHSEWVVTMRDPNGLPAQTQETISGGMNSIVKNFTYDAEGRVFTEQTTQFYLGTPINSSFATHEYAFGGHYHSAKNSLVDSDADGSDDLLFREEFRSTGGRILRKFDYSLPFDGAVWDEIIFD